MVQKRCENFLKEASKSGVEIQTQGSYIYQRSLTLVLYKLFRLFPNDKKWYVLI